MQRFLFESSGDSFSFSNTSLNFQSNRDALFYWFFNYSHILDFIIFNGQQFLHFTMKPVNGFNESASIGGRMKWYTINLLKVLFIITMTRLLFFFFSLVAFQQLFIDHLYTKVYTPFNIYFVSFYNISNTQLFQRLICT